MSHLKNLIASLASLKLSSEYWDVRVEDTFETNINIVDGEIVSCSVSPSLGAFIRVRKNGFWHFESTTELEHIKETLLKLDKIPARSSQSPDFNATKQDAFLSVKSGAKAFTNTSMEEKIQLLQKYESLVRALPKVIGTTFRYKDIYKVKAFLNSVGTEYEYDFNQGGFIGGYTLKSGESLFNDAVRVYGAEFSQLRGHDEEIKKHVLEGEKFLTAPSIEPGKYKVLLDPEVAGVFTHESFGHKSEADFMLGNAEALADWSLGKKIGADCLSIVDFGGHDATSGYCPIDDEGTPAQKNYLIKDGILTGRLHSLETSHQLGEKPTGNARALSFEWEPIVRMTSTYIEPGKESLEQILNRAEGAILIEGVKHGSGLSTFTIAPTRGYRILKNGERQPVRLTVISGSVFETLGNIEAVSSDFHLHSGAIGGCGKMEQMPLPVADGGPYVLVKEMQVS